jgi:hypothetical protein
MTIKHKHGKALGVLTKYLETARARGREREREKARILHLIQAWANRQRRQAGRCYHWWN